MKKYDIFLIEIDNKTPEAFDKLCRDFAGEFSISISGAKILLKQLPALLEIDVDEERAENYFKFFTERGGSIQLKNRQVSEIKEEKKISSFSDEFPHDEIDVSDFDILKGNEGNGNKPSGSTDSEQNDDIFSQGADSDSIDSILDMEDEFSLSLDSDENDDLLPSFEDESLDELSSETGLQSQVEESSVDKSADKAKTVLKHTGDKNKSYSSAETIINPQINDSRSDSGAETIINPQINDSGSDSGAETIIRPRVDEDNSRDREVRRTPFNDALKTCLSCRKSFSGPACPACYPEESCVGSQDEDSDATLTDKLDSKFVSGLFSRSSHKDMKKGLPVLVTEGFFLTFIAAVLSLCLYFIMPQKDILSHLIAPAVPLVCMVLTFITGSLSLRFKRKKESKGAHSLVRALATTAMVLTYPGQWVIVGNKKFYEKKKSLFSGKKVVIINIIFSFATILCLVTTVFLSKSNIFYLGGQSGTQSANKGEDVNSGTGGTDGASFQVKRGQETMVDGRYIPDSGTQGHKYSGFTPGTNHKFTSTFKEDILGKRVKVTLSNRNEFIGTIIGEGSQVYTMKSYKFGGTVVFSILKNDITHIALAPLEKDEKHFITSK